MTYKDWDLETDVNFWSSLASSIKKKAQEAQAPAQTQDPVSTARKLVHNLVRELGGQGPLINVTATPPQGTDAALTSKNISGLDNLLSYMWTNKIAVDGKQVVYRANEVTPDQIESL